MRSIVLCSVLAVLALFVATATGQVGVIGVVSTGDHTEEMTRATFRADSMYYYNTTGWGGPPGTEDTFDFGELTQWPNVITLYFTEDGRDDSLVAEFPVEDSWYLLPRSRPTAAKVKFIALSGGVEELPEAGARPMLEVSPSVLTDQVFIRAANVLEPGAGLEVLDALGNRVRSFPTGVLNASWAGKDDAGRALAEGVYFCRLVAGDHSTVRKVLLAR